TAALSGTLCSCPASGRAVYQGPIRGAMPSLTVARSLIIVNARVCLALDQHPHLSDTMTKTQLEAYRELLLPMPGRLKGEVTHLTDEALRRAGGEASGNLSNMPIHMADLGSDAFEQEFTLSLLENEEQRLDEINHALDRILQGKFGTCEECQQPIPKARLD